MHARADRLQDVVSSVEAWLRVAGWYGVRLFTDTTEADAPAPGKDELEALLAVEYEAGLREPYRRLGAQIHLVARRDAA